MLTLTQTDRPRPISDLAAGLTDQTLEPLSRAGVPGDSMEMELETWRALRDELGREFDLRTKASDAADLNLGGVIAQAIHRAALQVAGTFDPERSPAEIAIRVRREAATLCVPADRRAALGLLAPRPEASRRPLGRSGVVRPLTLTALN